MFEIIDKFILFACCMTLYLLQGDISYAIIPVIMAILLCSLLVYFDNDRIKLIGYLLFIVLCVFNPAYIILVPLINYDIFNTKYQYSSLLVLVLFIVNLRSYSAMIISFTFLFLILSFLLKIKTNKIMLLKLEYNNLRDATAEISLIQEEKNRSLLENQDYEINLATLSERNRISKEIHDNIGHLLSRALLQIGALLTITKEDTTKTGLSSLKESLSLGMDQIRSSIHNMYDESIDLYATIDNIVKEFTFCKINYDYDITSNPNIKLKYCFIAITKESLSNIIKHSHATKVSILLREHPAMYQLIIEDNGVMDPRKRKTIMQALENGEPVDGMGLQNISDRVKGFHGYFHISLEKGFKIFITIPKN